VVLISIDTLRADRLPAYGYPGVRTPNLDRLRRDSILYQNAYSPCPMTLPSHLTMLTGLLPPEHGVRNNLGFVFKGEAHANLPLLLKGQGYATGAAVSSYVLRAETGLAGVFDYYEDSIDPRPGAPFIDYQRPGAKTAAFAREWIAFRKTEPFFFFFHIYEPHVPYEPPEPFKSLYPSPYDGEVATADAIVGDFLADLKTLGVYDRAIIILTSDHGEGLGDHGEDQHSILLYLEALHIPLFLKLPGGARGGDRVDTSAQLSDILPTVTDLLGLQTPGGLRGLSLLRLPGPQPRFIYAETLYPRIQLGWSDLRSIIDGRYHYIHGPRSELYDIASDPAERNDRIATESATAARLARELERFPRVGPQGVARPDPGAAEGIAALGYIGGVRERGASPLPNPRDNLKFLQAMREGWRLAAEHRLPEAVDVLTPMVKANSAMVEVWIKLGDVYAEGGRDDEAETAYQEALKRTPVFLDDVALSQGYAQLRRGRLPEAEAAARRALPLNPAKARDLLTRVALARNRMDEALDHARAAASGPNPQPSSILLLAEVELKKGDPQAALRVLGQAEGRAAELRLTAVYGLEFLRADALARLERPVEAEAAYRKEIASFPGHAEAYSNLAVLCFLRGDRAAVTGLMEQMVKANPSPRNYLLAAATWQAFGDSARAATWRRRANRPSS
jgi:arylsulfatase A-like enzyme/Flp pilus assembly protein TadD